MRSSSTRYVTGVVGACLLLVLLLVSSVGSLLVRGPEQYVESRPTPTSVARNPSPVLEPGEPVTLHLWAGIPSGPRPVQALDVQFLTPIQASGKAELILMLDDGTTVSHLIDLAGLTNRSYASFALNGRVPVSGELAYRTGGGVATVETVVDDGTVATCVRYVLETGSTVPTPGCS